MAGGNVILVATDLSARCDRAVERAFALSDQLQARLVILHVLTEGAAEPAIRAKLEALIQADFGNRAGSAEILLAEGDIPTVVAAEAARVGATLILTGVARFDSPRDYILGTTVDELVRRCAAPVLVVKRRPLHAYECALVAATNVSWLDDALATVAVMFPNARLKVVQAYEAAFEGFLEHDSTAEFIHSEARQALQNLLEGLAPEQRARVESRTVEGNISEAIGTAIADWKPDLLVIECHGRTGLSHIMTSDTDSDPLIHEPLDVLVVRHRSKR